MAISRYKHLVHRILLEDHDARNSDEVLLTKVIKELCPEVAKMPHEQALMVSYAPKARTIERERRFWQAIDEDCMSDLQIARARAKKELEYREAYKRGRG